jgi:hypothetical protein
LSGSDSRFASKGCRRNEPPPPDAEFIGALWTSEAYQARDTRRDHIVAIKTNRTEFSRALNLEVITPRIE